MNVRIALLGIHATLLMTPNAWAGVTLTMQGKDQSVIYLDGNKMRIETEKGPEKAGAIMIYDGDAQKMIMTRPENKTYTEMTPQSMKAATANAQKQLDESMAKLTPEQRKQMEAAMAKLDPEQRKRMETMMSGRGGGASSKAASKAEPEKKDEMKWERTGSQQTVAGYRCEGFKEFRNGKLEAQGCYIPWNAGAVTKADLAPMMKMQEFISQAGWGGLGDASHRAFEKFADAPGFPGLWESVSSGGEAHDKQMVTSVKRGSVSSDKFQPPAGFSKIEMTKFGQ